jgi:hypothetical protein
MAKQPVGQAKLIVLRDARGREYAWKPTPHGDAWQLTDCFGQQSYGVVSPSELLDVLAKATADRRRGTAVQP